MRILPFPAQSLKDIVIARVEDAPADKPYFFAKNGEPQKILCHQFQGGNLQVNMNTGTLYLSREQSVASGFTLPTGDDVVLIRASADPKSKDYTRAMAWCPLDDWMLRCWALDAKTIYRVTAYDHRFDGKFQTCTKKEVELAKGTLLNIVRNHPRTGDKVTDDLQNGHCAQVGASTHSYKVRWEIQLADGNWEVCEKGFDPRIPLNLELAPAESEDTNPQ